MSDRNAKINVENEMLSGYTGCGKESGSNMWMYVLMGNMLRGIGETPIVPLGISYIDDFAKEGTSSFYLGNAQTILNFHDHLSWFYT